MDISKQKTLIFLTAVLFTCLMLWPLSYAQLSYSETIAVLAESHNGEVQAMRNYSSFAKTAEKDNYANIAYLFNSLAASEDIHAKNFKKILNSLGILAINEPQESEIKSASTKNNLKYAVGVELKEIDDKYPGFIKRIEKENYTDAVKNITFAWESEKQHRELIEKIRSNIGIFFGTIAKRIESKPTTYFVCTICGSTLTELPQYYCPICKGPVSSYKEIKKSASG